MIEAVAKIGEYVQGTASVDDLTSTFIENPNINGKYKFVLIVVLSEKNGEYVFDRVDFEEFNNYQKYLYKKGAPNGTDVTPTSKLAGNLEKTYRNRFLKWFQNYDNYDLSQEDKETLRRMYLAIDSKADQILADLETKFSLKRPNDNAIITLGIESNGELHFPGSLSVFNEILLRKGKDKYFIKKSQGESRGRDAVCSVCKQKKDEVYGFAIPWAFHTFDKPGFIAGGFEASDSWKNTPVCFNCATNLEVGKKYIEEKLDFSFYGFRYLLVPKLTLDGDLDEILNILGAKDQKKKLKLTREIKSRITDDEDEIFDLVEERKDFFSNSLVFYKKEQSSYRILLLVEGILPSRLRTLFKTKEKVDERFKIYNDTILSEAQREKIHLEFNFGVLRRFFPKESQNRTFDKIFLEIVDKIFIGVKIDYNLLVDFIMRRVRDAFIKSYPTNIDILNGFLLLHYINELDLFRRAEVEMKTMNGQGSGVLHMAELEGLPLEQRVERFFEANMAFFNSDAKKATFLEGVLAQKLLNIQWMDKNATPFRSKLHGLKMNEALIKRLLPEIQNKLDEYGKNHYYQDLERIIASHFVLSGVDWKEADDELSFYFALGMNLHKLFKNARYDAEVVEGDA
ncbi:MAG: Crispr-associated protein, TM1802 family [Methanothrix harundinacea]|jgi:CRISPR-associated protein Csh1|uniref:Crispr-associated protein, TM1802 family n=1 Tax=Methanothrix harundinacea TaxID=301375 RepID=A0A101FSJ6_9EURY|nr:MAG: Crispr-associated protein, TM1802 family [Methanothrix harundinacea]